MSNLLILLTLISIALYGGSVVIGVCKNKGMARKLFLAKTMAIFMIHGLFWTSATGYYIFKHPEKAVIFNLANYFSLRPVLQNVKAINKNINKQAGRFIPKTAKRIIQPMRHQTIEVANHAITRPAFQQSDPSLFQKTGMFLTNTFKMVFTLGGLI